ncbi:MAG: class I SAM-dependent methyltransferase [Parvibaculum sp.]|nr:class I SAM-dependent methyltransferase [Parvibaculum sp.]|tara:strand:- start:34174 stop:35346 length:1173 start_codon:yes stop_codon:yes gene_type:complete
MPDCSCCGGASFKPFFEFGLLPRTGFYLTDGNPSDVPKAQLNLEYCTTCGFIRQVHDAMTKIDYAEVERGTAQQLPHYTDDIIQSIVDEGLSPHDLIIEVGCNDGSFLKALRAKGFDNLAGVEPSVSLSQSAGANGFRVEAFPLTPINAKLIVDKYGLADAVVCRHTLEHVPVPEDLITAIAKLLKPNGICVIEVPDTDWIITQLFVHEIWDEHVSYFRPSSLNLLMQRHGLEASKLSTIRFRDTQNLVCFARNGGEAASANIGQDQSTLADIADCSTRWAAMVDKLQTAIAKAPRPIVAIGASHIQINFLNFAGLADQVDWMIDDDPRKSGRRAPIGAGVSILSTAEAIENISSGTVLKTAFPYPAWMDKITKAMALKGVITIDPFDLG